MAAGAAVLGLYGLWVAWHRLPGGLPAATLAGSWAWSLGLFAGAGAVLTGGAAFAAYGAARLLRSPRRPAVAAAVEAAILLPVLFWLLVNEFIYTATSEVLGYDTIRMVAANPGATFEAAWEMGSRYLLTSVAVLVGGGALAWRVFRRSYRGLWPAQAEVAASDWYRRPDRRLAGSLTGGLAVLAGLLAWQFHTRPSEALTVVCRAAPPLRALNLTRALIGVDLGGSGATFAPGAPLISEPEYAATLGGPRQPAPNVIMIVLESVPARALHCYGHPRADVSPNMDALAAGGVVFEHCEAAAPFSSYGLVSLMTSLYMLRAEANDHFADTSFPHLGLPRALKVAGYQLALFSSGNESFDNINRFYPPSDFEAYFSLDVADVPKPDCMRLDDHWAVEAFEGWIGSRRDARPFYCGFYLQSTHFNYEVPEPWHSHYQPVPPLYSNGSGIIHIPPDVLPLLKNQYDNALRYSDHWVGRIRAALEKAGAFDNSIVIIVGDHGEAFMEHGLARHGVHSWEEMIHIPLIVHVGPAARARLDRPLPSRVAGTVSAVDVAPTVAGLVGIRPHPSWQGADALAPGFSASGRPVFCVLQLTRWQESVVLDGFKYIYDLTDVQPLLFDLRADPGEKDNLATRQPELTAALHDILGGWHARQLQYYAARPYTTYLGPHEIDAAAMERFRQAASALRAVP